MCATHKTRPVEVATVIKKQMANSPIPQKPGPGYRLIFRASRVVNGKRLYAKDYGYRAWAMWVK